MSVIGDVSSPSFQDTLSPTVDSSNLIFGDIGNIDFGDSFVNSLFDPVRQTVDPTNSGDTGANQNTSSPILPSQHNPETAGGTDLGTILNSAINAGFSAWQLSTLPKSTPKTVQTQVGATRVTAGTPSLASSIFGPSSQSAQGSQLLVIGILVIVGILIYKTLK